MVAVVVVVVVVGGGGGGVVCVRVCVGMEGRWWLWVAREVCVFACVVVFRRV